MTGQPGDGRQTVAHVRCPLFLPKSETFIYNYLSNMPDFRHLCLAWHFANLSSFPMPREDLYRLSSARFTPPWLYYGLQRRYLGRDARAERIAEKLIADRSVRLLHAHFGPSGVIARRIAAASRIPLVTTFYGYDVSMLPRSSRWRRWYRQLFADGDLFLVEGPYMKARLEDLGCPADKIRIQRIAIAVEAMTFRQRAPKKKGEKVSFIFSGRLIEKKGLIYALQALRRLRADYSNFTFSVIGDGPQRRMIARYVRDNGMGPFVELLGFLSYGDYLRQMQKSDIFFHPSVTAANGDSEGGAPTTILEAQAMGMPVISSYHADIPNVVAPGESALLCAERDWEALAQKAAYLMDNPEVWPRMGLHGRLFVEERHNIRKEAASLEDRYDLLIRQRLVN